MRKQCGSFPGFRTGVLFAHKAHPRHAEPRCAHRRTHASGVPRIASRPYTCVQLARMRYAHIRTRPGRPHRIQAFTLVSTLRACAYFAHMCAHTGARRGCRGARRQAGPGGTIRDPGVPLCPGGGGAAGPHRHRTAPGRAHAQPPAVGRAFAVGLGRGGRAEDFDDQAAASEELYLLAYVRKAQGRPARATHHETAAGRFQGRRAEEPKSRSQPSQKAQ